MANFSVATSESWKDKTSGEWQEKTEWHRIVAWRHLAERAERYLKKGKQVYIEGRIETRKWTGQDGQDRYTTEIVAQQLMLLGRRDEGEGSGGGGNYTKSEDAPKASGGFTPPDMPASDTGVDEDDDLPF